MNTATLEGLVAASDWQGLRDLLRGCDADALAAAEVWYRRTGRAQARAVADRSWQGPPRAVQVLLALTLARTPSEASQHCRWGADAMSNDDGAVAACADALVARGAEWAAEFVAIATSRTFRGEVHQWATAEIVALTSAAADAYALDLPRTDTGVRGWAALIEMAHRYAGQAMTASWRPVTLLRAGPDGAEPAYRLGRELTLLECLSGTRRVMDQLVTAVEMPNGLMRWVGFTQGSWHVEPAIRAAVSGGLVKRGPLLDSTFRALSRDDQASSQRVLGAILAGLDPTPDEVRERAALIVHVLPTVHGSVTRTLLTLALAADLDDDTLLDLGAVILARTEKAQKTLLLTHLAAPAAGGTARLPLLQLAAESPDATLAAKARSLVGESEGSDPGESESPTGGLPTWDQAVTHAPVEPFTPFPATGAGLDQARSDQETWSRITTEAAALDLVVRLGHADPELLRSAVAAAPAPTWYDPGRTAFLLSQWVATGDARRDYHQTWTTHHHSGGGAEPVITRETREHVPAAHLVFTDRLIEETLSRLGTLPALLSTPTRGDGTLDPAVLARRVGEAGPVGYGPYDLVQALLRLHPVNAGDAALFAGLRLPAADGVGPDGVEVIRGWLDAGGVAARHVDFGDGEPRTSAVVLPLPEPLAALDGVATFCRGVGPGTASLPWGADEPGPSLGVCPLDVEHLATMIAQHGDQDSVSHAQKLPLIAHSAGPIGPAVHHHLARQLAHPRLDSRLLTAQAVACLAGQGRLDPELLRERSLALFAAGTLSLARVAHGWGQLAEQASLSVVWPAWVAVLDAACAAARKPAGLADLLRATRDYAPVADAHLPAGWLPASVVALASAKGSSKAAVEARALVAAVCVGGQSS